jgi:hypothetical protein
MHSLKVSGEGGASFPLRTMESFAVLLRPWSRFLTQAFKVVQVEA